MDSKLKLGRNFLTKITCRVWRAEKEGEKKEREREEEEEEEEGGALDVCLGTQ